MYLWEDLQCVYFVGDEGVGKTEVFNNIDDLSNGQTSRKFFTYKIGEKGICLYDCEPECNEDEVVTKQYLVLVFDITNSNSFNNLEAKIQKLNSKATPILLIGNKSDLALKRKVSEKEAKKFAKNHGLEYIEVSTLNRSGYEKIHAALNKRFQTQAEIDDGDNCNFNFILNVLINVANILTLFIPYLIMCWANNRNYYQENKDNRGSYFMFFGKIVSDNGTEVVEDDYGFGSGDSSPSEDALNSDTNW